MILKNCTVIFEIPLTRRHVLKRWQQPWHNPFKGIAALRTYGKPDSGIREISAVEFEIREIWIVESAIRGFGIRSTAQEIRNPAKDLNLDCNFHWDPGIRNPRCRIQNPRLWWILLHEAKLVIYLRKIVVHTNLLPITRRVTLTSFKSWTLTAMQKYCPASVIFMSLIWRFPFASCLNLFLSNFPRSLPQLISDVGRPVALHRRTVDLPTATVVFLGVVIKLTARTIKKKIIINNKMFCTIFWLHTH